MLVGFLMMQQVKGIDWRDLEIAIPAFLTIVLMPFTYSISVGIGAGFVAYVLIKVVVGKVREVHPLMWIVAALFVVYFAYTRSAAGSPDPSCLAVPPPTRGNPDVEVRARAGSSRIAREVGRRGRADRRNS